LFSASTDTFFLTVQSAEIWRANCAAPNLHSHCLLGVVTESWTSSVDGAYTSVVIPLWCCAVCKQAVINDYLEKADILSAWGGNDRLAFPPDFHPIWKWKYLAPTCRVVLLIPVRCNFWEFRWAYTHPGVCKCVRPRVSQDEKIVLREVNRVSWFPARWHKSLNPLFKINFIQLERKCITSKIRFAQFRCKMGSRYLCKIKLFF
jgi:hypothetical protein